MICGMTYFQICLYFLIYSFGGWVVEVKESAGGLTKTRTITTKSLVIASGGFTADTERCARIDPRLTAEVHTTANPYGTVWD